MLERATSTDDTDPASFEGLLGYLDELDVPDGLRAEIIGGNIVMSPWSRGYYGRVMRLLRERLAPHVPDGWQVEASPFLLAFPGVERAYGPDLFVGEERIWETGSRHLDGDGVSLVAELTSPSTRDDDLTDKVERYGQAGVPVYLLLDMQEERVTVHWTPCAKGYDSDAHVSFGETIHIPAPFNCDLDTTGFGAPEQH
ncbi:Uma2 family endonuclease [Streptomyces bambusae]|uniref:Uma2 family endonuclease n=2 Tax=Streptomyces bambusae TaxID=1550616 RepID=A0ABS6ZC15_9ACTN|nr:Uma2 family endonuclease [Streptomyces bambusae]